MRREGKTKDILIAIVSKKTSGRLQDRRTFEM